MDFSHLKYAALEQEEKSTTSDEFLSTEGLGLLQQKKYNLRVFALGILSLTVWSIAFFEIGRYKPASIACNWRTTTWSPAQELITFGPQKIPGDFFRPSPYRGAGDDVDRAWDALWMIGGVPVRIEESRLKTLDKSPDRNWTRVPDELGGGLAGYPEVYHQLHCPNMLRMATYRDHYSNHTLFVEYSPKILRTHIDHCVEIIRMQLQCTAEMTPVLTEILPGHEFPSPDFNVIHMCKNFEELKSWTEANVLHGVGGWDIPGAYGSEVSKG